MTRNKESRRRRILLVGGIILLSLLTANVLLAQHKYRIDTKLDSVSYRKGIKIILNKTKHSNDLTTTFAVQLDNRKRNIHEVEFITARVRKRREWIRDSLGNIAGTRENYSSFLHIRYQYILSIRKKGSFVPQIGFGLSGAYGLTKSHPEVNYTQDVNPAALNKRKTDDIYSTFSIRPQVRWIRRRFFVDFVTPIDIVSVSLSMGKISGPSIPSHKQKVNGYKVEAHKKYILQASISLGLKF